MLFDLALAHAVINELMNVYTVLKDEIKYNKMCKLLNKYETNNSEEFYYEVRNKDRNSKSFIYI